MYFEDAKHRSRRQSGYDACYSLPDVVPFVGVWNRFVERWNEVGGDRAMPLVLHQSEMAVGAHMFRTGARLFHIAGMREVEYITHPDFIVQIFFRRSPRFADGSSCCRLLVTAADIPAVECHYRTGHREAVSDWLAAEYERFAVGRNSYDIVIAYAAAITFSARPVVEQSAPRVA